MSVARITLSMGTGFFSFAASQYEIQGRNTSSRTNPPLETSRYHKDYEQLGLLSSGGYGEVFRARNRLDNVEYAVKKIRIRKQNEGALERALTEVKTLARLNHKNVVQYKSAWPEATEYFVRIPPRDKSEATSDETFTDSNSALCAYRDGKAISKRGTTLYVSMQLCDQNLREWLDERNAHPSEINITLALDIIRQATAGLEFIHSNGIIHHDIKPGNIFISRDSLVQVGDFGLACDARSEGRCPVLSGERGTSLYAAPEQWGGQCHQYSDIFSLGLVILELIYPFSTDMERYDVLKKARKGQLPPALMPAVKGLLKDLLAWNVDKRINATSLLKRLDQFDGSAVDKDAIIAELGRRLAQKEKQVRKLHGHIRQLHRSNAL